MEFICTGITEMEMYVHYGPAMCNVPRTIPIVFTLLLYCGIESLNSLFFCSALSTINHTNTHTYTHTLIQKNLAFFHASRTSFVAIAKFMLLPHPLASCRLWRDCVYRLTVCQPFEQAFFGWYFNTNMCDSRLLTNLH